MTGPQLIPTRADASTMDGYVANITRVYRQATPEQLTRGSSWYATANGIAEMIGHGDVIIGAGVLAALSPQTGWDENITRARATLSGVQGGHTRDALGKARRIMAGEDPADVLPHDRKTWHFYRSIVDPSDPDAVCIDRHAHDVAVGRVFGQSDRGLRNTTRYRTLARAYVLAASELQITPSALQAITWIVHRDALAGTGTRLAVAS